LDALPKHTYQVFPHPSFTISIPTADGSLHRINTCKEFVFATFLFAVLRTPAAAEAGAGLAGELEARVELIEVNRPVLVVPNGSRLCSSTHIEVWMGTDDISHDGSKQPLFRDSVGSEGLSRVVLIRDGGTYTVV